MMNTVSAMRALVLSSFANQYIVPIVGKALSDAGIDTIDLSDVTASGAKRMNAILDAIHEADLIVVELSDQSPNVMYELGIAHAFRKPAVILVDRYSPSKLPSDLAGFGYLVYDRNKPDELARELRSWIPSFSASRG